MKTEINRRTFLAGALAAFSPWTVCGAQSPARPLVLGAPLTHSDWMLKPGIQWGEAGVRHMLDACKATGWTRVYWRALDGGRALYPSRVVRSENGWDRDNIWNPAHDEDRSLAIQMTGGLSPQRRNEIISKFESLNYERFDSLAAAVGYGHRIGLEVHAWVSINEDDHGWGLQSDFSKAHPEFRWEKRDGRRYRSQLSFAFPEVRTYKLSILDELLTRYDVDGIFLDWIRTGDVRDNPQTDAAGVADSGYERPLVDGFRAKFGIDPHDLPNADARWVKYRSTPQTTFMRQARARVAAHRRKVPLSVLVGHPWHYRGNHDKIDGNLRGLLLDVAAWADEGLADAAVAAGYYRDGGDAEKAWSALHQETGGKLDVWTFAWVPATLDDVNRDRSLAEKLGAKQVLFWEADYIDDRPNAPALQAAMRKMAGVQ